MNKPTIKPQNPCFSSGPCAKRPGWSPDVLRDVLSGRSHRSAPGKLKLKAVIDKHRALLSIPDDYKMAIVPASDTGAVEMALWSLLGARGVDVLAWESFSADWMKDITQQLKLESVSALTADYGALPDLSVVNFKNDVVFVWNGTTSGVRVPDADWIADDREGLTICDATSAVFAYDLPWDKLDVTTWSWQKVLGSEAAHGMIVLSPRAVERLEAYTPPRPLPKIFRLTKNGKLDEGLFQGLTINTPSMLAVEDCLDALGWVESEGGVLEMLRRSQSSFQLIEEWVETTAWADFLAVDPATRSTTSVCLKIIDPWFLNFPDEQQAAFISTLCKILEEETIAYDIKSYRAAPPGLRIWCGATVNPADVEALLPWVTYAYEAAQQTLQNKEERYA